MHMKAMNGGEGKHTTHKLMPKHPTETKEITNNLLTKKITNNCCDTPTIGAIRENFQKLEAHIVSEVKSFELPLEKFRTAFRVLVNEHGHIKATRIVHTLAEAVADVEEVLQFYPTYSVSLQINLKNNKRSFTESIALPSVRERPPLNENSKLLFRLDSSAKKYAADFIPEATMVDHNWGKALVVESTK